MNASVLLVMVGGVWWCSSYKANICFNPNPIMITTNSRSCPVINLLVHSMILMDTCSQCVKKDRMHPDSLSSQHQYRLLHPRLCGKPLAFLIGLCFHFVKVQSCEENACHDEEMNLSYFVHCQRIGMCQM